MSADGPAAASIGAPGGSSERRGGRGAGRGGRGRGRGKAPASDDSGERPSSARGRGRRGNGRRAPVLDSTASPGSVAEAEESPATPPAKDTKRSQRGRGAGGRRGGRQSAAVRKVEAVNEDHSKLATELIAALTENRYECMICFDRIGRQAATWFCHRCFAIFHISCIKKWSRAEGATAEWRCPACNAEQQGAPNKYTCFCGKVANPEDNKYITPHSCGEPCGRMRVGTRCPHPCTLACHPGPCPPCPLQGPEKKCFCGKTGYRTRCSDIDPGRSCGGDCGRNLSCGRHQCEEECHEGPCPRCEVQFEQTCYCGKVTVERACADAVEDDTRADEPRYFSCAEPCHSVLACGNHRCLRTCHRGQCPTCPFTPEAIRTCPCGATRIEGLLKEPRENCLAPIPTCGNTCNKPHACGVHTCARKCHTGSCGPCRVMVETRCRCGSATTSLPCCQLTGTPIPSSVRDVGPLDLAPSPKFSPMAAAGPASFDSETGAAFLCKRLCKVLRECGKHQCGTVCCPAMDKRGPEAGDVHACLLVCGKKLKCGTHTCDRLCHRGHCGSCPNVSFAELSCRCGGTVLYPPIECGTKPPTCTRECSIPRPCGHRANHACHIDDGCSPCVEMTKKRCAGGHVIMDFVPCWNNDISCGRQCGLPMECGRHTCARPCHAGPCKVEVPDSPRGSCNQPCGQPRTTCEHICQSLCHPDAPCPPVPCKSKCIIHCPCRRRSEEVRCNRGGNDESDKLVVRALECDEECNKVARNARLAEALGVDTTGRECEVEYSEYLQNYVLSNRAAVVQIEQCFDELLANPRLPSYTMPPLDTQKREVVHELARFYSFDTASYDAEPFKKLVVSRRHDSRRPAVLLSRWHAVKAAAATESPAPHTEMRDKNTLHFFNLTAAVKTHDLKLALKDFTGEYRLQWIDDQNCIAVFSNVSRCHFAYSEVKEGPYKCRLASVDLDQGQKEISRIKRPPTKQGPSGQELYQEMMMASESIPTNNAFAALDTMTTRKDKGPSKMWDADTETEGPAPKAARASAPPPAHWSAHAGDEETTEDESTHDHDHGGEGEEGAEGRAPEDAGADLDKPPGL